MLGAVGQHQSHAVSGLDAQSAQLLGDLTDAVRELGVAHPRAEEDGRVGIASLAAGRLEHLRQISGGVVDAAHHAGLVVAGLGLGIVEADVEGLHDRSCYAPKGVGEP